MNETDLTLDIIGKGNSLTPFSSRECTQTLTPIAQGALRRTINGVLVCVGNPNHQKFQSVISCKDKTAPALSGVWKGTRLKVGCLQFLTQTILPESQKIKLDRPAVSLYVYTKEGQLWSIEKTEDQLVYLAPSFPGGYVTYRPLLLMVVKNYHLETDEWGLSVGWSLELEEE